MKYLLLNIITVLCLMSCKTAVPIILTEQIHQNITPDSDKYPDNGIYSIELIPNKSFVLKTGKSGRAYPQIREGEHTLLKFTYKVIADPDIQDSGYMEVIYADLGPTLKNMSLKNDALTDVSLSFGRLCFCGDQTGYWPVKSGNMSIITVQPNKVRVALEFKVTASPQIITSILETIQIPEKYLAPR